MTHRVRRPAAQSLVVVAAAGLVGLTGCSAASKTHPARAVPPASSPARATAQEVPGTATLNQGGAAEIDSVSCASAGDCSAGGYYSDSSNNTQLFVVSEVNGTWQQAEEVPGTAALDQGGNGADVNADVNSVSCASAGDCSAGGYYADGSGNQQALVVSQVNGAWQQAEEVPGTAALNKEGEAEVESVSCASAGDCSAGGSYLDGSGNEQAFVVSEVNGAWQNAQEVSGTAALNQGRVPGAEIESVSCASAGNCSAGGYYNNGARLQLLVVSEVKGTWQQAEEVPGTAALNQGGKAANLNAGVHSVSCASAGNCSAGGYYTDHSGHQQAFVVSEVDGAWQNAQEAPGTAALNRGGGRGAEIESVSCASAGDCSAGGYYTDHSGHQQAFVVSQVDGAWRKAEEVPSSDALNQGGGVVSSVSCASAGNCSAGGFYGDVVGVSRAFLVSEVNGTWQQAEEIPGTATLNQKSADVNSVSCASAGDCSAGGYYTDSSGNQQAFVGG
jgi:hypothetical protein